MSNVDIRRQAIEKGIPSFGSLVRNLNTYSTGANGGYLLSTELASSAWDKARAIDGPLQRCRAFTVGVNSLDVPALDETSRVTGSRLGGVRAYWEGNTDDADLAAFATQPAAALIAFNPRRLIVQAQPLSNDLLADSSIAEALVDEAAAQELNYAVVEAMLLGDGISSPLGIANAPCTIVASRSTPNSITTTDIDAMWSSMWPFSRRNAAWYCSDDTLQVLDAAATDGGWPAALYMPRGSVGNQYALIKGCPLIPLEQSPALGRKADLALADFSQYGIGVRRAAATNSPEIGVHILSRDDALSEASQYATKLTSEHFRWSEDVTIMRYRLRLDGKPMWRKPVLNASGTKTVGPFVILGE
jgi:HK97 family phage major capsid protein